VTDEYDKQIEGLCCESNGLAAPEQQPLLRRQNEVAEFENLIDRAGHRPSLANLQEKFKELAGTLDQPRRDHLIASEASLAVLEERGMDDPANCRANRTNQRSCITSFLVASTLLAAIFVAIKPAAAAPEDEVRATFDRFVTAQNSHDVKAVESLLRASPDFLWITRGTPVWGQDAALKRFSALYEGTWRLDPDVSRLKIMMLADGVAQIYVPTTFSIGAPGQPAQQMRFLMNQILMRTPTGWQVSSILPIPLPAQ